MRVTMTPTEYANIAQDAAWLEERLHRGDAHDRALAVFAESLAECRTLLEHAIIEPDAEAEIEPRVIAIGSSE